MALTFSKAEFPTLSRDKKANEYLDLVKDMIETGEARSTSLSVKNEDEEKALDNLVYAVQSAGRELGVSVRKAVTINKETKTATVTFITREKITRTRKPTEPVPADSTNSDTPAKVPVKKVTAKPGPRGARNSR